MEAAPASRAACPSTASSSSVLVAFALISAVGTAGDGTCRQKTPEGPHNSGEVKLSLPSSCAGLRPVTAAVLEGIGGVEEPRAVV